MSQDGICKKSKRERYSIMRSFLLINNSGGQHFAHFVLHGILMGDISPGAINYKDS